MKLRIIRNIEPYEYHCFPCLSQEVTYADLASIVSKKDSMEFLQEKLYKIIFNQHLNKMTWSVCVSAWCHGKEKPDILYGLPPNRTSYQRRSSTRSIFRYWRRRTRRRTISSRHARHILEIFINGLFFLFFTEILWFLFYLLHILTWSSSSWALDVMSQILVAWELARTLPAWKLASCTSLNITEFLM